MICMPGVTDSLLHNRSTQPTAVADIQCRSWLAASTYRCKVQLHGGHDQFHGNAQKMMHTWSLSHSLVQGMTNRSRSTLCRDCECASVSTRQDCGTTKLFTLHREVWAGVPNCTARNCTVCDSASEKLNAPDIQSQLQFPPLDLSYNKVLSFRRRRYSALCWSAGRGVSISVRRASPHFRSMHMSIPVTSGSQVTTLPENCTSPSSAHSAAKLQRKCILWR
jgi:hypothetical protein